MVSDTTHTLGSTPPMPRLIDSHCHLHDSEFYDDVARETAYQQAVQAGIAMIDLCWDGCAQLASGSAVCPGA